MNRTEAIIKLCGLHGTPKKQYNGRRIVWRCLSCWANYQRNLKAIKANNPQRYETRITQRPKCPHGNKLIRNCKRCVNEKAARSRRERGMKPHPKCPHGNPKVRDCRLCMLEKFDRARHKNSSGFKTAKFLNTLMQLQSLTQQMKGEN